MNEEIALETRRLRSFSNYYSALWDLYTRQAEIRKLLFGLNEEFSREIPKSRLVLYLKRKDKSYEYSALHWGFTIPGLKAGPHDANGRRKRRIKHISTPLNDTVIHTGGGDVRRKLFFDFDRRRLAANASYRKVTKAITTVLQILKGRAGTLGESGVGLPLPPPRVPGGTLESTPDDPLGLPGEALQAASLGWKLLGRMLGKELELLRLAREVELTRTDERLRLVFSVSGPDGEVARAGWTLEGVPLEKLLYVQIRGLQIPEAHQKRLSTFERKRRDIEKVLCEDGEAFQRLMELAAPALALAHQGILEARRKEVDGYGRPLTPDGLAS